MQFIFYGLSACALVASAFSAVWACQSDTDTVVWAATAFTAWLLATSLAVAGQLVLILVESQKELHQQTAAFDTGPGQITTTETIGVPVPL